jgi:DNA-binding NtrC family response regulator
MAVSLSDYVTEDLRIPGPQPGSAKLAVLDGPRAGLELVIGRRLIVGTGASCDLVLDDASVSREHLAIEPDGDAYRVHDLDSRNGTYVGTTRLKTAHLPLGAVITLGRTHVALHPGWRQRRLMPSTARRFGELYGESLAMREVFTVLDRASRSEVSVLIEGETGTGKELAARSIHSASARATKPFVVFDCASVPPNLAESELFGHVRGAFSGAVSARAGAFQRAAGGTLFLDEMGELPEALQPKLLRVLESGELRSVGSDDEIKVDVRVLAATNRDLHAEAQRGRFRSDLLYRLDVVRVRLPPLRQRPEDIPGLVRELLMGQQAPGDPIEGANLRELVGYHWPGNVRELRNVLRRALTMSTMAEEEVCFDNLILDLGPVREPASFGLSYPGVAQPLPFKKAKELLLGDFERRYLDGLMNRHDGNLTHAAKAAGLSRKHLYDLLRKSFPEAR